MPMTVPMERDDLLLAYAAGLLPEAPSLVVASHACLCSEARKALSTYETVAGSLLEDCEEACLSPALRASVLARLDTPPEAPPEVPAEAERGDRRIPAPLRRFVGDRVEALPWRRLLPGFRECLLPNCTGGTARLLWVRGGTRVPAHTHKGVELTLVLQGAFTDCTGTYKAGDLQLADDQIDHGPVVEKGESCLCLVVTQAPVRLTGRLGRLINRFLRY